MSAIDFALRGRLNTFAGLLAVRDRIFPNILPQAVQVPCIKFQVHNDIPSDTIEGKAGLFNAIVSFEIYAGSALQARSLADQVRLALQGWSGTSATVVVRGSHIIDESNGFDAVVKNYTHGLRFSVWYNRTNPS